MTAALERSEAEAQALFQELATEKAHGRQRHSQLVDDLTDALSGGNGDHRQHRQEGRKHLESVGSQQSTAPQQPLGRHSQQQPPPPQQQQQQQQVRSQYPQQLPPQQAHRVVPPPPLEVNVVNMQ